MYPVKVVLKTVSVSHRCFVIKNGHSTELETESHNRMVKNATRYCVMVTESPEPPKPDTQSEKETILESNTSVHQEVIADVLGTLRPASKACVQMNENWPKYQKWSCSSLIFLTDLIYCRAKIVS